MAQNLAKSPHKINVKFMWEIFSNFVTLSEYIAFKGGGEKIRPLNFTEGASKKGWAERLGIMIDIQIGKGGQNSICICFSILMKFLCIPHAIEYTKKEQKSITFCDNLCCAYCFTSVLKQ